MLKNQYKKHKTNNFYLPKTMSFKPGLNSAEYSFSSEGMLVLDRNHCFGLGLIPKPKPKLLSVDKVADSKTTF